MCRGFCLQTTEIIMDHVDICDQICTLNRSPTAAVQQNERERKEGNKTKSAQCCWNEGKCPPSGGDT